MKWKSNPNQFGSMMQSRHPNEGEDAGVEYDPFTREPSKKGDRRAYSNRPKYTFVEFVNAWLEQDWPPDHEPDPEPKQEWKEYRPGDPGWEEVMRDYGGDRVYGVLFPGPGEDKLIAPDWLVKERPELANTDITGQRIQLGRVEWTSVQVNPEWNEWFRRRNDPDRGAHFLDQQQRQAMQCVLKSIAAIAYAGFGQRICSTYHGRLSTEQRQNPDKSMRHHVARLARHVGDALVEAVVALADGKPVPDPVWKELRIRGGTVVLNLGGKAPSPRSKKVNLTVFDTVHVLDDLQLPGEIISRAVQYLVGSFFTHLVRRAMGSGESLRRCIHVDGEGSVRCNRIFVGRGVLRHCEKHQGDSTATRARSRAKTGQRAAEWAASRGDWPRRRQLLRKYFGKVPDVDVRINRFGGLKRGKTTAANCSYKTALKWWRETR